MTRVAGKFQITLPKRLVEAYGIHVGDEVELVAAGDTISIVPAHATTQAAVAPEERLRLFDAATARQQNRNGTHAYTPADDRRWTRDELYTRARPR